MSAEPFDKKAFLDQLLAGECPDASYENVCDVRRDLDPYGVVIDSEKRWANICLTNYRDIYWRRFLTTSLTCYLHRQAFEYKPHDELERLEKWYDDTCASIRSAHDDELAALSVKKLARRGNRARDAEHAVGTLRVVYDDAVMALREAEKGNELSAVSEAEEAVRVAKTKLADAVSASEAANALYAKTRDAHEKARSEVTVRRDECLAKCEKKYNGAKEHAEAIAKRVIGDFLRRNWHFDPDRHVRKARTVNSEDPERRDWTAAYADAYDATKTAAAIEEKMRSDPEKLFQYLRGNVLASYQNNVAILKESVTIRNNLAVAINALSDLTLSEEAPTVNSVLETLIDQHTIISRRCMQLENAVNDAKRMAEPLSRADCIGAYEFEPPADVFHHFDRFVTNNWETLRDLTRDFYAEKPDIEYAVVYYREFGSFDDAVLHRKQHENEFKTSITTIESGGVMLLGPFKTNRDRVEYLNSNTGVLKAMQDQTMMDTRLGTDIMKKQIKVKKEKDVRKHGADPAGLSEYMKSGTMTASVDTLASLGAVKGMTRDEQEKLLLDAKTAEEAREVSEMEQNLPNDAIMCEVLFTEEDDDGGARLARKAFYTQAEAPLHLQEGSEFAESYQPPRTGSIKLSTKTIQSKDGKLRKIASLAK